MLEEHCCNYYKTDIFIKAEACNFCENIQENLFKNKLDL